MRNQVPFAAVLLLALGFSVRPMNQAAKPDNIQKTARRDSKKNSKAPEPQKTPPDETVRQEMDESLYRFIGPLEPQPVWRFVIATVPNPEIAYCALPFDTVVESIQLAADAEGYQLRQFWLPWERDTGEKESGDKKVDNLLRKKALEDQYGMLLFRGEEEGDSLAVLLVSETPTLGLNYAAFAKALDFIREHGNASKVSIVGPSYSGTATQLKEAIQAARRSKDWKDAEFVLASGSASSVKKSSIEEPHLTYHAFTENVAVMQVRFLKYLHEIGIGDRVAMLSEAGTVFGSSVRKSTGQKGKRAGPNPDGKPAARRVGESTGEEGRLLHLPFPMAIGRLRNARESDPGLSARLPAEAAQVRRNLELKLNDGDDRKTDRLPTFSPDLTAVSQEMVMQNITASIRRERIQAVGISATDVLDALFLAQMVQDQCPNTRVFTLNTDNLFQHVSPKVSYYGLLLVSPYPLFTGNQDWQRGSAGVRQLLHFSNRAAQGVYNAFRWSLTNDDDDDSDCDTDTHTGDLIEYGHPSDGSIEHPPVWVSVVGRDGLWPLKVLDEDDEDKADSASTSTMQAVTPVEREEAASRWLLRPSALWYAGLWVLAILGAWRILHAALSRAGIAIAPAFEVPDTLGTEALFYHLSVDLALLAAMLPATWVQYKYLEFTKYLLGKDTSITTWLIPWLMFFLMAVVAAGLLTLATMWAFKLAKSVPWIVAGLLGIAAIAIWVTRWTPAGHPFNRRLLVLRCLFPEAGVSPLVPPALMCLGIASWAGMQLQRLRLREVRWPGHPDMSGSDFRLTGLNECAEAITASVSSIRKDWLAALLGASVFTGLMVFLQIHGLEWRSYDYWVCAAAAMLTALVVFTLTRFLILWFALRGILARLDSHSIRDAFERLGKKIPDFSVFAIWRIWHVWQGDSRKHALVTLVPSVHRLVKIQDWVDAKDLQTARCAVDEVLNLDVSKEREKISSVGHAAGALNRIATQLVRDRLPAHWPSFAEVRVKTAAAGAGDSSSRDVSVPPDPDRLETAEDFVALRWAAFIRAVHAQLRNKIEFMSTGCIALLLSTVTYPIQPHHTLVLMISSLFIFSGSGAVLVFYQMERNAILSRMSRKAPGKIGKQFYTSAIAYGAVPLMTLLAYQFPELTRFLFSIMGPALQSLR